MTTILEAIILGIVQGVTEWLPVSSSGHLVLVQHFLKIEQPLIFDLFLHLGSLIVVFFVFRNDLKKLILGILRKEKVYLQYLSYLILATIPIGLVGFFFKDIVEAAFGNIKVVGYSFLFTALIVFLSKYPQQKEKSLTWKSGLIIGLGQAIAILPGVSRSGTTISTALMQGIKQEEAARFSFLLFIPAILGATVLELTSITPSSIENVPAIMAGVITTMIVGFFSLKLLLRIVHHQRFSSFAWYCLGLGILIIIFF